VRRSGHTIRVTAQLINAVTGFHLWSKSYDRDLGDVLKLQTEIATAVAEALKVTLLGNFAAKIELGGTRNPAAFDAYLRATKVYRGALEEQSLHDSIARYSEAIQLDPDYAMAYANRSIARFGLARNWATGDSIRDYRESAQADARKAILLAPDLAEGHLALATLLEGTLEFRGANQEYRRALELAPGNAKLLSYYGAFAVQMGQIEVGLEAAHRSVVLDPLNFLNYLSLGISEMYARRYGEALMAGPSTKNSPNEKGTDQPIADRPQNVTKRNNISPDMTPTGVRYSLIRAACRRQRRWVRRVLADILPRRSHPPTAASPAARRSANAAQAPACRARMNSGI